jgi:catechol 2,3-dioxygenase-like lactoylglutathione lyase family enzyme
MATVTQAHPILASLDWDKTVAFYEGLGFSVSHRYSDYLIIQRDGIEVHFWNCNDRRIAESTGCYIRVSDADALYEEFVTNSVKCSPPVDRSWGPREFHIVDPNGNLLRIGGPPKPK